MCPSFIHLHHFGWSNTGIWLAIDQKLPARRLSPLEIITHFSSIEFCSHKVNKLSTAVFTTFVNSPHISFFVWFISFQTEVVEAQIKWLIFCYLFLCIKSQRHEPRRRDRNVRFSIIRLTWSTHPDSYEYFITAITATPHCNNLWMKTEGWARKLKLSTNTSHIMSSISHRPRQVVRCLRLKLWCQTSQDTLTSFPVLHPLRCLGTAQRPGDKHPSATGERQSPLTSNPPSFGRPYAKQCTTKIAAWQRSLFQHNRQSRWIANLKVGQRQQNSTKLSDQNAIRFHHKVGHLEKPHGDKRDSLVFLKLNMKTPKVKGLWRTRRNNRWSALVNNHCLVRVLTCRSAKLNQECRNQRTTENVPFLRSFPEEPLNSRFVPEVAETTRLLNAC